MSKLDEAFKEHESKARTNCIICKNNQEVDFIAGARALLEWAKENSVCITIPVISINKLEEFFK